MIRCLFIQGMTDYWLRRQPWKNSTKELALPCWMMWFPPKILLFPRNDLLWEWRKMVFLPWEMGSRGCRGLEPQELAGNWDGLSWGLSLPSSRPSILGALPLAFLQSLGEGLAGSGGELPPQEVLCARSPSRASLLCPSHGWNSERHGPCTLVYFSASTPSTLYPVSLPLLGSSEFTTGPGGEFNSRCPNNETFP